MKRMPQISSYLSYSDTSRRYTIAGNAKVDSHPFRTVDCVFNHISFYGNIQPENLIGGCSFDLNNSLLWKAMDPSVITALVKPYVHVSLCLSSFLSMF